MPNVNYSDILVDKNFFQSEAYSFAKQLGITNGAHNGDLDAFRHAYVSARFTQKYGPAIANLLGQINEIQGNIKNNQPPAEQNMDLWNNAIGREIGAVQATPSITAQKVLNSLQTGNLILDPTDSRTYYDTPPLNNNGAYTDAFGNIVRLDVVPSSVADHDWAEGDFLLSQTTDSQGHILHNIVVNGEFDTMELKQSFSSLGLLTSREVITTNAAGTITTAALDSNADNIIDKTTNRLDIDRNGIAESIQTLARDSAGVCRREDYTLSPVGLPSTSSYTFRAGFDSELANKEVVSTAGNGLVSKVRSEFDAQSHITVANSVLAVNADLSGRTSTAQQVNGTWVQDAWHYSAAGSATGHELSHLPVNQSMADITAYNALGQADVSTTFALDGSSVVYAYDYDNGRRLWIDLDQDQDTAVNKGAGIGKSRAVRAQNRWIREQFLLYIQ